jgi:hypothetical protein
VLMRSAALWNAVSTAERQVLAGQRRRPDDRQTDNGTA